MEPTVTLTQSIDPRAQAMLEAHGVRVLVARVPTPDEIETCARQSDAIIVRAQLPNGVFRRNPRLRTAVRHGVGVDFIPVEEATSEGVIVANLPGSNTQSVAEYAVGAMLNIARRTHEIAHALYSDGWDTARAMASETRELADATVGILGYGNVGRRIAVICRAGFGMRVLTHSANDVPAGNDAQNVSLEVLRTEADYLVLACPLTNKTRGLVDSAFIAGMRRGACLINVARGPIVNEGALARALRDGHLAAAVLDVYENHPFDASSPLWKANGVFATPHCAGITGSSMQAMGLGSAEVVIRVLRGEPPASFVNPEVWMLHRQRHAALPIRARATDATVQCST